jgi:hypothetical protein
MKTQEDKASSLYFKSGIPSNLPTFKDEYIEEVGEEQKNILNNDDVEKNMKNLDPNDVRTLLWLGSQDMSKIMEILALPTYLEKPPNLEELRKPAKFDFYF